jgi:isoleucyl-tRNA synthetase
MGTLRDLVSSGLQVRTANKLRVRQPLEAAEIVLSDPGMEAKLQKNLDLIRDELNVHEVHFVRSADEYVTYQVKPNFRALGPRVGKKMPALKKALASADGAALLAAKGADGLIRIEVEGEMFALSSEEIGVGLEAREGFAAAAGSAGVVVLRTSLSPELLDEGLYREVLNRIQTFRKELDLEYTARIRLSLSGDGRLMQAVRPRVDSLAREVLADEILFDSEAAIGAQVRDAVIDGENLKLGLELIPESA